MAMVYTTPRGLSAEELQRVRDRFSNAENFQGMPILEGSARLARHHGPCTQCGAPDETGAHVCAYCLSPRQAPAPRPQAYEIEVTCLDDEVRRFVPAMQDESFRT